MGLSAAVYANQSGEELDSRGNRRSGSNEAVRKTRGHKIKEVRGRTVLDLS